MSYWSHNPELYTEIIFKEMVHKGLVLEDCEDIEEVVREHLKTKDGYKTALDAEADYWGGMIDDAKERRIK